MDLPWLGQNLPQWLQKGTVLQYDGTKSYEAKLARYTFPTAVSLEMKITDICQRYYTYSQTDSMSATGFPSQYGQESQIGGIGQPGGLVLPPAALVTLHKGQVIDADQVTGITVSVKNIGQDAGGRNIVILQATNQAYSAEATYDMDTGSAIAFYDSKLGEESNEYTDLKLTQIA